MCQGRKEFLAISYQLSAVSKERLKSEAHGEVKKTGVLILSQ
jgi:hypothetical protein